MWALPSPRMAFKLPGLRCARNSSQDPRRAACMEREGVGSIGDSFRGRGMGPLGIKGPKGVGSDTSKHRMFNSTITDPHDPAAHLALPSGALYRCCSPSNDP